MYNNAEQVLWVGRRLLAQLQDPLMSRLVSLAWQVVVLQRGLHASPLYEASRLKTVLTASANLTPVSAGWLAPRFLVA
jgi:hypothetical protein